MRNPTGGLTLQDIQADSAEAIDVRVVDLGEEADLGWCHGVVVGQEEFELEDAAWVRSEESLVRRVRLPCTFVWRLRGTVNLDVKVAQVVFVGDGLDSGHAVVACQSAMGCDC